MLPEGEAPHPRTAEPLPGAGLPLLLGLFALSGALSLVYEILWLRSLILIFGATTFAVSAVLTAFMGGLALGSFVLGRHADRFRRPGFVYGVMEIGIGLYALLVPFFFGALVPFYRFVWERYEPSFTTFSLLKFACALGVLLIPTTLMGGTLPVLSRFVANRGEGVSRRIGMLYAVNTAGAVVGTAAAGFLLLPRLGMTRALWVAAAGNMALGLVAIVAFGRQAPVRQPLTRSEPVLRFAGRQRLILGGIAASGAVAMVFEVAWTRVIGLVIGGSVYSFTTMLTTFLVGLAVGAACVARVADRTRMDPARLMGLLMTGTGLTAFLTLLAFHELPYLFAVGMRRWQGSEQVLGMRFAIAFAVMLLPTVLLGGLFPAAVRACVADTERLGEAVGRAYAINTLGTIVGSALAGFVLLPAFGARAAILGAIVTELALGALLLATGSSRFRWLQAAAVLATAALVPAIAPGWDALVMNSGMYLYANDIKDTSRRAFNDYLTEHGAELLYARDGATSSIIVVREREVDNTFLATNGKVDASTRIDLQTQLLLAHLPLLLAPEAREVLVVGLASGITAGAVLTHPVSRVTAVEIEPAVLEASEFFREYNNDALRDPRTRVILDDARNRLLVDRMRYDVIISEPSNPWITVASNLFTREAWDLVRERLTPGGIFCQWIQLYGIQPEDLKALLRTFHDVFPEIAVFTTIKGSDLAVIGSARPLRFSPEGLSARMRDLPVAVDLARIGVRTPADLLSYFDFGTAGVERLLGEGEGPTNTDDNARIEFATPRSLMLSTGPANAAAIAAVLASPAELLDTAQASEAERTALASAAAAVRERRAHRGR
jgi:spermidine synthase